MTREEAIKFANCLKNNYTIDFDDMAGFCDMAIKALKQESILDKIRAEIDELGVLKFSSGERIYKDEVLDIIDKYKSESEESE